MLRFSTRVSQNEAKKIAEMNKIQMEKGLRSKIAVESRSKEMREKAFENYLSQQDKSENVQKQQRADEYRNRRMYVKINIEDANFNKMQREKQDMMEQRKLFGMQIQSDKLYTLIIPYLRTYSN